MYGEVEIGGEIKKYKRHYTTKDYSPWFYERRDKEGVLKGGLGELPPCTFGVPIIDWVNQESVRNALNIPDSIQAWDLCTSDIGYDSLPQASQWIYPQL
jgi:hypothetical protein